MSEPGFIDLRIGHGTRGTADDSVWPSFTDIMTVVVMIFLMALVVIMVRNNDLNRELVASINVNDSISKANQGLSTQINALAGNLNLSEAEKKALSDQLLNTIAKNNTLTETKAGLEKAVEELLLLKASLTEENLSLLEEKNRLILQNTDLTGERDGLKTDKTALEAEKTSLLSQSAQLTQGRDLLATENEQLKQDNATLGLERDALFTDKGALGEEKVALQSEVNALLAREQLLSTQLLQIEKQFSQLKLDSGDQISGLNTKNLTLSDQLDQVNLRLAQLKLELDRQNQQQQSLTAQLAVKEEQYLALQENEQSVLQRFTTASEEIDRLTERIKERDLQIAELQQVATVGDRKFVSLQDEYNSLEEKYRSLVRAARSPAGKQVATVIFRRDDSGYQYGLRDPGEEVEESLTRGELETRLENLKQRFGRGLYARVVIPEDSNLSHNEAWRFTQDILNKYDYYYQDVE